jgi:hypothetical protein
MRFENFDNHTKPKLASEFNGKKNLLDFEGQVELATAMANT